MKYKKYISTAFLAFVLLPFLSAKSVPTTVEEFDINSIVFIENEQQIDLGFDTSEYLPEGFDPYAVEISINDINFMEEETVELDFETALYLPQNFNPYLKK